MFKIPDFDSRFLEVCNLSFAYENAMLASRLTVFYTNLVVDYLITSKNFITSTDVKIFVSCQETKSYRYIQYLNNKGKSGLSTSFKHIDIFKFQVYCLIAPLLNYHYPIHNHKIINI